MKDKIAFRIVDISEIIYLSPNLFPLGYFTMKGTSNKELLLEMTKNGNVMKVKLNKRRRRTVLKLLHAIKEKCPWISYVLSVVPFVVGCIGYAKEGLSFWETVYAALAVYFVNPVNDMTNGYILFAEITSVLVVASIILSVLRYAYSKMGHFFIRLSKDATVVYTDNEMGQAVGETVRHGYVMYTDPDDDENKINKLKAEKVRNHIVMFTDDMDNVSFISKNEKKLQGDNVYLMLRDVDPTLLDAVDESKMNLHFFNVYDVLARDYWKKYNLYDRRKGTIKIAIIGFDQVGNAIFKYGYLNNIFSLVQSVEYHIWGASPAEVAFLNTLHTMNDDKIIVHDRGWEEDIEDLAQMDRVIYTFLDGTIELIQFVLYVNPLAEIHCYSDTPAGLAKLYLSDKIVAFGDMKEILTEESIENERLYRQGKLFNYDYSLRYSNSQPAQDFEEAAEREWKKLNGFFKSSNIARADHYWIEQRLKADGEFDEDSEDAWRIEHIRWSRFYYVNHWTYAKERDNARRKHHLLVPYEELEYSEKAKDGIYSDVLRAEIDKLV